MSESILYLGDTHLTDAAAYLAGLMHSWGWPFDYLRSDQPLAVEMLDTPRSLFVVSDYPAARMSDEVQQRLLAQVSGGAGLLMIGGWESYHGLGGDWDGTPVAEILPVEIENRDDRMNCDHPAFVRAEYYLHPITRGLPWDARPPLIGGYNRFVPRVQAETILHVARYSVSFNPATPAAEPVLVEVGEDPLLVIGSYGQGRVAALATDVAPHWVGPLVDWGPERVQAQGPGAGAVEVGNLYAQFFRQLVGWTGGFSK